MTCERCKELFVDAYYGDLDDLDRIAFQEHLASCEGCTTAFHALEETQKLMLQRKREEPDEAYWSDFWQALKPKIESEAPSTPKHIFPIRHFSNRPAFNPSWTYGIAAMLLIGLGMYLGRTIFISNSGEPVRPPRESITSSAAVPDSLSAGEVDKEIESYLDRSRTLLLGLINSSDGHTSSANFAKQQHLSRELIQQARILEAKLKVPDRERFKQLVGDLGVILRELANYSVENGVPLIELVKQGVDKKSILLKINLEQIRVLDSRMKPLVNEKKNDQKSKI